MTGPADRKSWIDRPATQIPAAVSVSWEFNPAYVSYIAVQPPSTAIAAPVM